jgi:palmitoyltransferase
MATSFFNTLYHAYLDPGILTIGDSLDVEKQTPPLIEKIHGLPRKVHAAPSLDSFHEQAFYECDEHGNPLWCQRCKHWKPNRTHHSRMLDRCILKFDHYCPWVGGYTTATNFKSFLLFSVSAAVLSLITLVSIAIPWNHGAFDGHHVTGRLGVTVGFAVFFLCLAGGTGLSAILLASANLTTIDNAVGKRKTWRLAVRLSQGAASEEKAITAAFSGTSTFTTGKHTFAIVETSPSANPYDIGILGNWKQVMGNKWWEWVLPFKLQGDDGQGKMTEITPAVAAAIEEVGLGKMDDSMRERWEKMQARQKGFLQLLAAAGAPLKTFGAWQQARKEGCNEMAS